MIYVKDFLISLFGHKTFSIFLLSSSWFTLGLHTSAYSHQVKLQWLPELGRRYGNTALRQVDVAIGHGNGKDAGVDYMEWLADDAQTKAWIYVNLEDSQHK